LVEDVFAVCLIDEVFIVCLVDDDSECGDWFICGIVGIVGIIVGIL